MASQPYTSGTHQVRPHVIEVDSSPDTQKNIDRVELVELLDAPIVALCAMHDPQ